MPSTPSSDAASAVAAVLGVTSSTLRALQLASATRAWGSGSRMSVADEADYDEDDFEEVSEDDALKNSTLRLTRNIRPETAPAEEVQEDPEVYCKVREEPEATPEATPFPPRAPASTSSQGRRPRRPPLDDNGVYGGAYNSSNALPLASASGGSLGGDPGSARVANGETTDSRGSRGGSRGLSSRNLARWNTDDLAPARPPVMEQPLQERAGSSGSSTSMTGRRVVRGKVSVSTGADDGGSAAAGDGRGGGRPGTGDSTPGGVPRPAASVGASGGATSSSSKPLWLQHDESVIARHRDPFGGLSGGGGGGSGSGDHWRPSKEKDVGHNLLSARTGNSRRRQPSEDPFDDGDGRVGSACGDADRRVKRLQGEIQRLTQRLKEAEMFSAQDELPRFTLDEVETDIQIGQGGFSSVHSATWHGTRCALKKIFDPIITEELKSEFENEVKMLRRLRHPNIVILMAVCRQPPALSILTELVTGGSLFDLLHSAPVPASKAKDKPSCDPSVLLPLAREAAAALAYLHAMLVVHRDVKSQNVLLTEGRRPVAKLCDFGLARMKSELCTGTMQWAGTAAYMAPELFAKKRYNEMVDVFAAGVMLWEVASTEMPHANLDPEDIGHKIKQRDGAGLAFCHSWPKSLKNLLRSAMAVQPDDRPSMAVVVQELAHVIQEFPVADD